jgi:hypothetical protein
MATRVGRIKYIEYLYSQIVYYSRIYIISIWGNDLYFSALVIGESKTRIVGHVANMAEKRYMWRVVVGRTEGE